MKSNLISIAVVAVLTVGCETHMPPRPVSNVKGAELLKRGQWDAAPVQAKAVETAADQPRPASKSEPPLAPLQTAKLSSGEWIPKLNLELRGIADADSVELFKALLRDGCENVVGVVAVPSEKESVRRYHVTGPRSLDDLRTAVEALVRRAITDGVLLGSTILRLPSMNVAVRTVPPPEGYVEVEVLRSPVSGTDTRQHENPTNQTGRVHGDAGSVGPSAKAVAPLVPSSVGAAADDGTGPAAAPLPQIPSESSEGGLMAGLAILGFGFALLFMALYVAVKMSKRLWRRLAARSAA